jgi:hypothetical protein
MDICGTHRKHPFLYCCVYSALPSNGVVQLLPAYTLSLERFYRVVAQQRVYMSQYFSHTVLPLYILPISHIRVHDKDEGFRKVTCLFPFGGPLQDGRNRNYDGLYIRICLGAPGGAQYQGRHAVWVNVTRNLTWIWNTVTPSVITATFAESLENLQHHMLHIP